MSTTAHSLRVIAGGKFQRPDFFVRTAYLSIEIDEVITDLLNLSAASMLARANRDRNHLAETNALIIKRTAQLRAMTACIEAHCQCDEDHKAEAQ